MKILMIAGLLCLANVTLAAEKYMLPTEPFRRDHVEIKAHLEHVRAWVGDLALAADGRAAMVRIVKFFQNHIKPHAEWEERVLYPAVDKRAGSPPPYPFTATMRYEHRIVSRWIEELALEAGKAKPDIILFQRRADNLLGLIGAHFEEEEEVLLPILDKTMTPAEFEKEIGHRNH